MSYELKVVSAYLGVPPDTVRKWESRYKGLVAPARQANGYRRYSEGDLRRLLAFAEARRKGVAGTEAARGSAGNDRAKPGLESRRKEALAAFERFDRRGALALFERALKRRGARRAFAELWLPVLAELGARAHAGAASWVSVEHFASAFLRERVLAELARAGRARCGEVALCSPGGDRHELGLLLAACALEESGVGTLYLGADLPWDSLDAALTKAAPRALALGLTARRPRAELKAALLRLRARHPRLPVFVCGQESLRHANLVRDCGAVFLGTDLERATARIAAELKRRR